MTRRMLETVQTISVSEISLQITISDPEISRQTTIPVLGTTQQTAVDKGVSTITQDTITERIIDATNAEWMTPRDAAIAGNVVQSSIARQNAQLQKTSAGRW